MHKGTGPSYLLQRRLGHASPLLAIFFFVFSRSLIGQLSFLLVSNMVHAKMNVHKHRTKQTYESNKF